MIETILKEGGEFIISLIALAVACFKGNKKSLKTAEEIEEKEEAKKQKRIAKQLKKNKIKPIENNNNQIIETVNEVAKTNWQQAYGIKNQENEMEE